MGHRRRILTGEGVEADTYALQFTQFSDCVNCNVILVCTQIKERGDKKFMNMSFMLNILLQYNKYKFVKAFVNSNAFWLHFYYAFH